MTDTATPAKRTRIDTLTDAERATFPGYVDRWTATGLRTGPLNADEWAQVEAAARRMYGYAGLPEPRVFLGVASPLAAAIAASVAAEVAPAAAAHLGDGVEAGVRVGVRAGVSLLAPYQEWLHEPIRRGLSKVRTQWYAQYRGGNLWCSSNAWATWFRDHGLDLGDDLWNRLDADNTMCLAGPSWWFGGHCIVSDRPTELHVENVAGVNRLHCGTGTAIAWADGWGIYSWHGVQVPADLIEDGWPIDRIMREENAEVRRCAVEILADRDGWAGIIRAAGWQQIGADAPDPGNPGQRLSLYRVPALTDRRGVGMGLYREPVNLLRCTNATVERSGERHEFGLTVPADITDPTEASAWTFDLPVDLYRALQRAC